MRNRLVIALALATILVGVGHAQEAEEAAHASGYSLGLLRGLLETDFIIASQYDGAGTMLVDGQMVAVSR